MKIPPATILTAVDFSDGSRAALAAAARLAAHTGATLHVVHADDPLLAAAGRREGFDVAADTMQELRRFVSATLAAPGLNPRLHTATGEAAPVILELAATEGADLVVVGSIGMSGIERMVFGSTTERVLKEGTVPVLVVPPTWTAPAAAATAPAAAGSDPAQGLTAALGTRVDVVRVTGPDLPDSLSAANTVPVLALR